MAERVAQWGIAPVTPVRAARIALAIERYRRDHEESLPATLGDLVPEYLSGIPIDPYAGQPLRFSAASDHYTVYGVGPDRADDGGEVDGTPGSPSPDAGLRVSISPAS